MAITEAPPVHGSAVLFLVAVAGMTACAHGSQPTLHEPAHIATSMAERAMGARSAGSVIGPLDVLEVTVLEAPEFTRTVRVSEAGAISLPLLGHVPAAGLTPHELEEELAARLRDAYMVDPQVSVHVTESASEPIYVVGEVQQPGAFTAAGANRLTVLQAVALARGLKPAASRRGVYVIRSTPDGSTVQIPVPITRVLSGQEPDLVLEPSDIVYVPTNMERSVALGVVNALVRVVTFRAVF
jgi:polysaccharide biosynthesis/export protein